MQMLTERNSPEGTIDYPKGGTGAIVDALIRGLHKHGGSLLLRAHVDQIIMEGEPFLNPVEDLQVCSGRGTEPPDRLCSCACWLKPETSPAYCIIAG